MAPHKTYMITMSDDLMSMSICQVQSGTSEWMLSSAGLWYVGGFQREMRNVDHALFRRPFFMDFDCVRRRAIICNVFAAHSRRNGSPVVMYRTPTFENP